MSEPSAAMRQVTEFHRVFAGASGAHISETPTLAPATQRLRVDLIREELKEYEEALEAGDIIAVADALADLAYVIYGAALTHGLPLDALIAEVHRSNMTKLGADGKPIYRSDGKVLKGPNYSPPDIAAVLSGDGVANGTPEREPTGEFRP